VARSLGLPKRAVEFSLFLLCLCLPVSIAGANISWGVLLASLLAYRAAGGPVAFRAHRSVLEWPLGIYLGVAVLTAALGVDPGNSFRHIYQDVHKLWLYLLFSVALATEPAPKAILAMAAGFSIVCLTGLLQVHWNYCLLQKWTRAQGFVHAVTFGEQVCIAVLGAVCFLVEPPEFLKSRNARLLSWTFLVLALMALFLSQTRGAILSMVAGAAAIALLTPKLRRFLVLALLVTAASWYFANSVRYANPLRRDLQTYLASGSIYTQGPFARLRLWSVALCMGRDHPWTGVGLNNYRVVLPQYLQTTFEDLNTTWGTAHNLYLHQFAERGILGLAALLWLLGAFWWRAYQRVKEKPEAWNLWAYGTATAFLFMNLTEVALQVEILWMLVFFVWIWAEVRHQGMQEGSSG